MAGLGFCAKCEMGVAPMREAGKAAQTISGFDVKISECGAALT